VVFLLAVVTAASFRSLAPASVRPLEATDFRWYRQVAENLEAGRGFTFEGEQLAVRYPPGYPIVLAGLFRLADGAGLSHDRAVDGFIPLVVGVCAVLAFLVARRLFGTGVAWLSALLWITHPMNLAMASQPYSELPFTAVVYAAVLLFIAAFQAGRRVPWAMLAVGALVGAASLIRPIAVGLVAVFAAAAWVWARKHPVRWRVLLCVALLVGDLLVVLPWEVLAWQRTGQVLTLSTGGGYSLQDGLSFGLSPEQQGTLALPGDVRGLVEEVAAHPASYRSTGAVAGLLGRTIAEQPMTVVKLLLIKASRAWYGTQSLRLDRYVLPVQAAYLALVAVGMVLAVRRERYGGRAVWLLGGMAVYFWLLATAVLPLLRYMTTALGLLLMFAAVALRAGWRLTHGCPGRRR
jgi:hypothetical protein